MKRILIAPVSLVMLAALLVGCGKKDESRYGGTIVQSGDYKFETVFSNIGVEIYPTRKSDPVVVTGVVGSATVRVEGKDARWADLQERDGALFVPFAFPVTAGYQATVDFNIQGLDGAQEASIDFSAPYEPTRLYGWTCRKHPAITTLRRGKCVKCDQADKVPAEVWFQCPNHPEVVSFRFGECEKCDGVTLALRPVGDR